MSGPKSLRTPEFWLSRTGNILAINTTVFLAMVFYDGNIFLPEMYTIWVFGAKDLVALTEGAYWRLFSPIFIHIGVIHFTFNNLGLYFLGSHIEESLGGKWFLLIYLAAGLTGNLASFCFNVSLSAGASGALFGLLGCGFYIERLTRKRINHLVGYAPGKSVYTSMLLINLAFGVIVPGIDNAAHFGGLLGGIVTTHAMLRLRRNHLLLRRPVHGIVALGLVGAFLIGAFFYSSHPEITKSRLISELQAADLPESVVILSTQILQLDPEDEAIRVKRVLAFLEIGKRELATSDLLYIQHKGKMHLFRKSIADLKAKGRIEDALLIESFYIEEAEEI